MNNDEHAKKSRLDLLRRVPALLAYLLLFIVILVKCWMSYKVNIAFVRNVETRGGSVGFSEVEWLAGTPFSFRMGLTGRIRYLRIDSPSVTELEYIASKRISDITIQADSLSNDHVEVIAKMNGMFSLKLEVTILPDMTLKSVGNLESLAELCIETSDFGNNDVNHLRKLRELRQLILFGINDADDVCGVASKLVNLETFAVGYQRISTRGVSKLGECRKLTFLALLADETATRLLSCSDVSKLVSITNLEYLNLDGAAITDSASRYFESMSNLKILKISGASGVTDKSADSLSMITNLRLLDVTGTRMTEFGANQIRSLNPGCIVELEE